MELTAKETPRTFWSHAPRDDQTISTPPPHEQRPAGIDTLKPLVAKGSLETVKRICQRLNEVMYFAIYTGLIDNNPLAKISEMLEIPTKQHML